MKFRTAVILTLLLTGLSAPNLVGQNKYGVKVETTKPAALATAKTYVWAPSLPSPDKEVDAWIVAAVDRELSTRGFTKLTSGASDVLVSYASQRRTDVDPKARKNNTTPELAVGVLIVDILEPKGRQPVFRVRMDTPIDADRAGLKPEVDAAVAAMFKDYPLPKR